MISPSFKLSGNHPFMLNLGGGQYENNRPFQGMILKSLKKKNFSIIPLFGFLMLAGSLIKVANYQGLTKPRTQLIKIKDHRKFDGCCAKFFEADSKESMDDPRQRLDQNHNYI